MEQHPVPQNVTTFQFRLVGDMTIKQFGYLAGGAILAYVSYKLPLPFFFTWPLAALFALGGFGFAFIPIEERPMDVWFLSFIKSVYSPTQFLWQKTAPSQNQEYSAATNPAELLSHNPLNTFVGKLLDRFLPVPGPKKGTVPKSAPPVPKATSPAIQQTSYINQNTIAAFPTTPVIPQGSQQAPQQAGFALKPVMPQQATTGAQGPVATQPPVRNQAPAISMPKIPTIPVSSLFAKIFSFLLPAKQQGTREQSRVPNQTHQAPLYQAAMVPNQTQPRAGTNILAKGPATMLDWFFDMFRPRQSTVLQTSASSFTFPNVLNTPPTAPVTGKHLDITEPTAPPVPQKQTAEEEQKQKEAQSKAHELEDQVKNLTQELQTKQMSEGRILELQKQLMEALEHRNTMEQELSSLRHQLTQKRDQPQESLRQVAAPARQTEERATVTVITPDMAVKAGLPRLTTFPNVVTGIIKDNQGNLLPAILVTVKDKEDIPVRALKTNKLGQFAASTPLANGIYTIDIEDPKGAHLFDRVRVTLNGSLLSPVEVIARTKKEMDRAKLAAELFGPTT